MKSTIQGLGSRVCCCRVDKALLPRSLRELQLLWNGTHYDADVIGIILGTYWDNGKENGTYYNGLYNALKRCEVCFCKYFHGCRLAFHLFGTLHLNRVGPHAGGSPLWRLLCKADLCSQAPNLNPIP